MEIITEEIINNEFTIVESISGKLKNYHSEVEFQGYGKFCDVYFLCKEKPKQKQIDVLNEFVVNHKEKLNEIDKLIIKNLNDLEQIDKIKNSKLYLDVISIPENNLKYDLVVVCSKSYKSMYFFSKTIGIRIEYKNGQVKSSQIKKNTTEDNN